MNEAIVPQPKAFNPVESLERALQSVASWGMQQLEQFVALAQDAVDQNLHHLLRKRIDNLYDQVVSTNQES